MSGKFRIISLFLLGAGAFIITGYLSAIAPHLRGGLILILLLAMAGAAGLEYLEVAQEAKENHRSLKFSEKLRVVCMGFSPPTLALFGIWAAIGAG